MKSEPRKLIAVKRVELGPHHFNPGKTRHMITDKHGSRPFPPFKFLEVVHYENSSEYYLLHICADGQIADTWHRSLEDAFEQAEWEFGVKADEWRDVDREF